MKDNVSGCFFLNTVYYDIIQTIPLYDLPHWYITRYCNTNKNDKQTGRRIDSRTANL